MPRIKTYYKIGSDPEFLFAFQSGEHASERDYYPQQIYDDNDIPDDGVLGQDGDYGELRPEPAKTAVRATVNIGESIIQLKGIQSARGYNLYAHTGGGVECNATLGGHIHMSWLTAVGDENDYSHFGKFMHQVMRVSEEQLERFRNQGSNVGRSYTFMRFLALLDFYVGVPLSKAINGNRGPWASFGAIADYDFKHYGNSPKGKVICGIEYRTPPSFLKHPHLYFRVMRTVTKLLTYLSENSMRETFTLINPMREEITGRQVLGRILFNRSYSHASETHASYRTPEADDYKLIKLLPEEIDFMTSLENYDIGLHIEVDAWINYLEQYRDAQETEITEERGSVE